MDCRTHENQESDYHKIWWNAYLRDGGIKVSWLPDVEKSIYNMAQSSNSMHFKWIKQTRKFKWGMN